MRRSVWAGVGRGIGGIERCRGGRVFEQVEREKRLVDHGRGLGEPRVNRGRGG